LNFLYIKVGASKDNEKRRQIMEKTKHLPLYDIYEVSWLHLNGVAIGGSKQSGRVVFEVPATEETYQLLHEYQTNPEVAILDFVRSLRRVRGQMLDLRDGDGKWERETQHGNYRSKNS
jgi:hypothetical protein